MRIQELHSFFSKSASTHAIHLRFLLFERSGQSPKVSLMLPRNHCYQYNKMQYYCLYHHKSSLCNSYHWFSPFFLLQEVDQAVHLVLERDVFSYDAFTRVRHAISRKIIIGKSFIIVPNWFEIEPVQNVISLRLM